MNIESIPMVGKKYQSLAKSEIVEVVGLKWTAGETEREYVVVRSLSPAIDGSREISVRDFVRRFRPYLTTEDVQPHASAAEYR